MRIATLLLLLVLALPSRAGAQDGSKLTHALLGVSFVLHGIDIAQSMYAFGRAPDRFTEANPLLRPLQGNPTGFGAAKMGLAAGVNYLLLTQHEKHPRLLRWSLVAGNAVMLAVVVRNARTIDRLP